MQDGGEYPDPFRYFYSRLLTFGAGALFVEGADAALALTLTSPAFKPGAPCRRNIPARARTSRRRSHGTACRRERRVSRSILDDPDAPDPKAPRRVWVHWVLYNIPPEAKGLAENADKARPCLQAPSEALRFRKGGVSRSMPADRQASLFSQALCARHHGRSRACQRRLMLEAAMKGHVLAQAELIGTYQKGDR